MTHMWEVRFTPEAWVNNYATAVDCEGPNVFAISDRDAAHALGHAHSGGDWDYLSQHCDAPSWIQSWRGPYTIELVSPSGDPVTLHAARTG